MAQYKVKYYNTRAFDVSTGGYEKAYDDDTVLSTEQYSVKEYLPDDTIGNWTQICWKDDDCNTYTEGSPLTVTKDITLYAEWTQPQENMYDLYFVLSEGIKEIWIKKFGGYWTKYTTSYTASNGNSVKVPKDKDVQVYVVLEDGYYIVGDSNGNWTKTNPHVSTITTQSYTLQPIAFSIADNSSEEFVVSIVKGGTTYSMTPASTDGNDIYYNVSITDQNTFTTKVSINSDRYKTYTVESVTGSNAILFGEGINSGYSEGVSGSNNFSFDGHSVLNGYTTIEISVNGQAKKIYITYNAAVATDFEPTAITWICGHNGNALTPTVDNDTKTSFAVNLTSATAINAFLLTASHTNNGNTTFTVNKNGATEYFSSFNVENTQNNDGVTVASDGSTGVMINGGTTIKNGQYICIINSTSNTKYCEIKINVNIDALNVVEPDPEEPEDPIVLPKYIVAYKSTLNEIKALVRADFEDNGYVSGFTEVEYLSRPSVQKCTATKGTDTHEWYLFFIPQNTWLYKSGMWSSGIDDPFFICYRDNEFVHLSMPKNFIEGSSVALKNNVISVVDSSEGGLEGTITLNISR